MIPTPLNTLTWERSLLKQALAKHVHRSDPQAGMRQNAKTVYGEDALLAAEEAEPPDPFHHGAVHKKSKSSPNKAKRKTVPERPQTSPAANSAGTLDVLAPRFGGALLKCRISKCVNIEDPRTGELKDFLRANCSWRPMPLQALGGQIAETAFYGRAPTPRRDVGRFTGRRTLKIDAPGYVNTSTAKDLYKGKANRQIGKRVFQGKKFRLEAMPTVNEEDVDLELQRYKEMVADVESWSFMRHIPLKISSEAIAMKRLTLGGRMVGDIDYQMLYSDVKAILEHYGEGFKAVPTGGSLSSKPAVGTPTALEIVQDLPRVTRVRWLRICEESETKGVEVLARHLVKALQKAPNEFKISSPNTLKVSASDVNAGSIVQLLCPNPGQDDEAAKPPVFLNDPTSHGGRSAREERFNGIIKVLKFLPSINRMTEREYGFMVEDVRLFKVAKAIDRAESMRLRGHVAAAGDRIHCSTIIGGGSVSQARRTRRGRYGITPDWLLAAIAEASDDEDLESGDCLRLLVEASAVDEEDCENLVVSGGSWVNISRNLGLLNRRKVEVNNDSSDSDNEKPTLNPASSTADAQVLHEAIAGALNPDLPQQQQQQESEAARLEAMEDYSEVKNALETVVGNCGDEAYSPFILELLLQLAVRDWPGHEGDEMVPGGSAAVVYSLLWMYCGWDSPIGRRLIRRLCVAFNNYAHDGVLSRQAFVQLAADAGWVSKRDMSQKNARLFKVFSEIVGEQVENAEFGEFILLIEQVALARCAAFFGTHHEDEGLAPIPGDGKLWPFIERAVLQATRTDDEPTSPIWLRRDQMRKRTEDNKDAVSVYSRCSSRASLSSANTSIDGDGAGSRQRSRHASTCVSDAGSRSGSQQGSRRASRQPSKGSAQGILSDGSHGSHRSSNAEDTLKQDGSELQGMLPQMLADQKTMQALGPPPSPPPFFEGEDAMKAAEAQQKDSQENSRRGSSAGDPED